jgi:DNA-directed RNA polymerase specialized sigma24 family protein
MNKQWTLTQAALDSLLTWLDPDREKAGERYEAIRTRLIKIFTCRGCPEAEDLADETINRVTSKLGEVAEGYQGDPALFFYGVAKKVRQEYDRRKFKRAAPLTTTTTTPLTTTPAPPDEEANDEHDCLEMCMRALPAEQRTIVIEYYREEKRAKIDNRKRLALKLGVAINALRIRAHRIRSALQSCVEECVERKKASA